MILSKKNISSKFLSLTLAIIGLILISPIFSPIRGFSTIVTFLFFISSLYFNYNKRVKNLNVFFYTSVYFIFITGFLALYHSDIGYITLPFFLLTSLYFTLTASKCEIIKFVELSTNIILVIVIGAVLGFFYAFYFGQPLYVFKNPNGLENYLFLTTLTNLRWGNYIRPSGIYDEPGALSFFICAICFMRHLLYLNQKKTIVILILGLITLSVAHVIFLFFYFVSVINLRPSLKNILKMIFSFISFSAIVFVLSYSGAIEAVSVLFLDRFQTENSYLFPGDNRSLFFFNALSYITDNPSVILLGMPIRFNFDNIVIDYGVVGSNPLMPLLNFGIFVSLPYYIVLLILFFSFFRGRYYVSSIGFALILFQREFIFVVSYSLVILMTLKILLIVRKNEN